MELKVKKKKNHRKDQPAGTSFKRNGLYVVSCFDKLSLSGKVNEAQHDARKLFRVIPKCQGLTLLFHFI